MDIATMDETVELITDRIEKKHFTQHTVVNVAKLINMRKDTVLNESVRACEIISVDGMGIVLGARLLGYDVAERVAGIDLFHRLLQRCAEKDYPIFLLGAKDTVVAKAHCRLMQQYPGLRISGHHHGYFWDNEAALVENIRESGAYLLFVAISSPAKETFIHTWSDQLGVDFVMGVGGTFDVVAGKVKRAPEWMQRYGLEWFYRIIQEPGRMWKRYLITNSQFAWLLLKAKLGQQK